MKLKYSQSLHYLTHTSHYKTVMIGAHVVVAGHKLLMQKLMMAFFSLRLLSVLCQSLLEDNLFRALDYHNLLVLVTLV